MSMFATKPVKKTDPVLARAFLLAALVEGAFFVAAAAVFLLTTERTWGYVLAVLGMVAFSIIAFPALKASKARAKAEREGVSPNIVEGG